MNIFKALESIQEEYKRYVFSFQRFKNPTIRNWVNDRIIEGTLLWKDPYIQLNRSFKKGDSLKDMVEGGLLHEGVLEIFTVESEKENEEIDEKEEKGTDQDKGVEPIHPFKHQSDAIRTILEKKKNTIVSTGTGSGKSYCFGIPIVNTCLEMKDKGIDGIKAIIVYPMNALANSQYEDFSRRLHGSGLKIALYTGDTETSKDEALRLYKETTGRGEPWDSEMISREEIQNNPPDILMTNYVMLDLIFSRFDDKSLFPPEHKDRLKYLVLDEIHTYTGQRGADLACLIRRVKQRTETIGKLRCIGTSATVQAGEEEDGAEIVARFSHNLFEESFEKENVIGEIYEERKEQAGILLSPEPKITDELINSFEPTIKSATELLEALTGESLSGVSTPIELGEIFFKTKTFAFIADELKESSASIGQITEKYKAEVRKGASFNDCKNEIMATLLIGTIAEIKKEKNPNLSSYQKYTHSSLREGQYQVASQKKDII